METSVTLRPASPSDADLVRGWFNDESTRNSIPISPMPTSHRAQLDFLSRNGETDFVLFVVQDPSLRSVGIAGLHQIDWEQRRARTVTVIGEIPLRSRGLGSAARASVIEFAFSELNLNKVLGAALVCNEPAVRLLRKTGLVQG